MHLKYIYWINFFPTLIQISSSTPSPLNCFSNAVNPL